MKRVLNKLKNWIDRDQKEFIRTFLLSEGFGFCLCLSFVWGYRLDHYGNVSGWLIQSIILSLVLGVIVSSVLMLFWMRVYDHESEHSKDTAEPVPDKVKPSVWIISSVGLFVIWLPVWLAYFPAVFAYDAETQLGQVISGVYSTHHPLLHTLLMGGCMKLMWDFGGINAGMALYAFVQMAIMAVTLGWVIAEAHRMGTRTLWLCIYGVTLVLLPVSSILSISTTKDVLFSAMLVVCILFINRTVHSCSKSDHIRIAVFAALMICLRNNALYALILSVAVIWLMYITKYIKNRDFIKPLVIALVLGCIAGCFINTGLKLMLNADSGSPREALSIPIQQMARVDIQCSDKLSPELRADLEKILDGSVNDRYDPHLADPVKKKVYMKEPRLFVSTWLKLGIRFPGQYLDAWLYTTEGAWYIADVSANRIYGTGTASGFGYLSTDVRPMPYGFEVQPHSYLPGLRGMIERIVSDNAFEKIPVIRFLFAPALYIWILVLYLHYMSVIKERRGILVMVLPIAVYLTVLMGPAILIRYMYPFMLLIILPVMNTGFFKNGYLRK